MRQLKRFTVAGILFVLITGTLSHFLYDWTENNVIAGLFTPVNESVWEHMKLLFFPMLLYSFTGAMRFRKKYPCILPSLCLGILTGTLAIPILFYSYMYIIGKDIFLLDIGIFILSVIAAFIIAFKFTLSCKIKPYAVLLYCITALLFLCLVLFTYAPPNFKIFEEPAVHGIGVLTIK